MPIPSVTLYIRRSGTRKYERLKRSNINKAQPLNPGDVYCLHIWHDNTRKWITVGTDLKAAFLREMEEKIKLASGKPQQEAKKEPESLRVDQAIKDYIARMEVTRSGATASGYDYTLKEFRKSCTKEFLKDITKRDLEDFVFYMKKEKLSDRTCHNRVGEVVTFLRAHDILNVKHSHKYMKKPVKPYTETELASLFAVADQEEEDLITFLLGTGARDQEVQQARWSDVEFVLEVFNVEEKEAEQEDGSEDWEPKDKERRTLKLADNVVAMLKARKARRRAQDNDLIFPAPKGGIDGHLLRRVDALAKKAGLKKGGLHRFRKTFATTLHRNGVDARTIQARLGHSDIATTLLYLKDEDVLSQKHDDDVNKAFGSFGRFGQQPEAPVQ